MPPTQKPQDKLEDWQTWLADDLRDHMCRLLASREIQRSWNEILETTDWSPYSNGTFNEWVNNNYIDSLAVDIRAITDRSQDTRSLKLLLDDLEKSRSLLPQLSIDPTNLSIHNSQLTAIRTKVGDYVNRRVAHHSTRPRRYTLTIGDVHQAADTLYDIYHHWHQNVCNVISVPPTVTDTALDQWECLFTQPWISPNQSHTNRRPAPNRIPKKVRNMAALLSTTLRLISVQMVTHPPPQIIRPCSGAN